MHACTSARKHPRMPGKRNQAQHKHQPHGATKTLARGHQQGTNQGSARPNATDGRNALGVEKLHGRGALRACPSLILLFNEQLGPSIAPVFPEAPLKSMQPLSTKSKLAAIAIWNLTMLRRAIFGRWDNSDVAQHQT